MKQLRTLAALGWGKKHIARELGIARNSVNRYLREGEVAETQTRPRARTLDADQQATVGRCSTARPRLWGSSVAVR